jgi:LCP family protein required for cell wall assembly
VTRKEAKARKKKRQSGVAKFLLLVFLLAAVFTAGKFVVDKYGFFGLVGGDAMEDIFPIAGGHSDFAREFSNTNRVNILFLGTNHELSDTIMVFSFDMDAKRVDEISVPRDTYYERPAYPGAAYQKINSAYETEGFEGAANAVSNVLGGMPVHFYAQITDEGVAHVVDAMGGIEMDVPIDMNYEDAGQGLYIHLNAGPQLLDGDHAVQYLRFRSGYANADLGRVSAQQEFLKEAFRQSIGFGFPKVAAAVLGEVNTNISGKTMTRLGSAAIGMDFGSFQTWTIPGTTGTVNGASYFFADAEQTQAMTRQIYNSGTETSENAD